MGAECCGSKPSCGQGSCGVTLKLCIMMFVQFFVWGAWFTTPFLALGKAGIGGVTGEAYGSAPIAAMIAPLFLGIIADRFFASEKVMGVLLLIGGAAMCAVPHFAAEKNAAVVGWLFLAHMLCYMPTLGLGNTIAFANIKDATSFGKIRVWGTIGWIAAGLVCGFLGWSDSLNMFMLAGVSSLALGAFSFMLPTTPPPAKGQPLNLRAIFMVDAFKMLLNPAFAVFIVCSTLICVPLAYYYGITGGFLANCGFSQPASSMTIGQMSEIGFMLLIPFFFRKLGVKWMILVGMLAWVARYLLFAFGAPDQVTWMLFLAIALHGVCYDFFFVTGFIYTEKRAPKEIKGQAQSMLVFFTQGIGMFFGFKIAFAGPDSVFHVAFNGFGNAVTKQGDLDKAIAAATPPETLTFGQQLAKMFSVNLPASVDHALVTDTMTQWKSFWMVPALMAAVIAVLFFAGFWDKTVKAEEPAPGDAPKAH